LSLPSHRPGSDVLQSAAMTGSTFKLDPGPAAATRLAQSLVRRLGGLARELDATLDDAAVHRVRKDLKRARALVRLVRPAIGGGSFRAINVALRDAGRTLAGRRDARVLVETLDRLIERAGLEPAQLAPFAAELRADWQSASGPSAAPAASVPRAASTPRAAATAVVPAGPVATPAEQVRAAAQALRAARVRGDWPVLADGLYEVHRRVRRALRTARREPSAECLHEWRKQVKHSWHASELLEPVWPRPMRALAREAHRLADRLGEDHDLAVLRARLAVAAIEEPARGLALAALDAWRRELQRSAFRLGERLYAEPPRRFVARVGAWYQAGSERSG
jgi:CHAD domain-containing protein